MHADGDWQAVEGALSKDMATLDEYLQTWKLKLSTTTTVSAVFHLNNKEAKRELKVNFNYESLPFCSEPKNLGVTLDRSLTYRRHLESLRKKLTSSHVAREVSLGNKVHHQKRLMLCTIKELYSIFKENHPSIKIGLTKFQLLKPKWCVCSIHQNAVLLADGCGLSYKDMMAMIVCSTESRNCMLHHCDICLQEIAFSFMGFLI